MDDIVDLVRRSLADETYGEFTDRVDAQADQLRQALAAGEFDNEAFSIGLEVELYAINSVPEPPEPASEDEEESEAEADEAALDEDLSGDEGESAWDSSLEPQAESGGRGASLELDNETPPPDESDDGDGSETTDSDDSFGPGEGPSLDVDPDSPLAPDEPDEPEAEEPEPAVEAEAEADDEPYMDPEEWEGRLTRLPDVVFEGEANKELGLHNAEINTAPNTFDETGMEVQTTAVEMHTKQARAQASKHNCELILDAMWTITPDEGGEAYLSAHENRDGVVLADNMRQAPRYVALDNEALQHAGGHIDFSVPGYEGSFPTILFESLATSIQPHLQIPSTDEFPAYYNAAIRTLGPLLALSVNSPFLPADFYPDDTDGEWLCANTDQELRIAAFEQSVNTSEHPKVKVPRDLDSVDDVVDRVVADDLFGPFLREWLDESERDSLEDRIWEFDHKRGTYWRWLRCVIGGTPVEGANDDRSLRIEYRPLPTQPHVKDMIGLQALTVGLIRGLVVADHPVTELPWQEAERSFYSAAADGLDADLSWVTIHGERTTDHEVIFDEVLRYARLGLEAQEIPEARIDEYLDPIEARWEAGETPSSWKVDRVRSNLDDGLALDEAIAEMQRAYFANSREHHAFAEWL
jgi:gamma-glutamyl:cysteine ligase YbdK (ATP-grasp superfamily)